MKPFKLGQKEWKKGQVIQRLDQRSYEVETNDGTIYRRNRVHLNKSKEMPSVVLEPHIDNDPIMYSPPPATPNKTPVKKRIESPKPGSTKDLPPRGSASERHLPKKFDDYILNK